MITLFLALTACLIAAVVSLVLWKISSSVVGALIAVGLVLLGAAGASFMYWVHFYLGHGEWPFHVTVACLGASVVAFAGSFVLKLRATARRKERA
jgi:hypothetical protein